MTWDGLLTALAKGLDAVGAWVAGVGPWLAAVLTWQVLALVIVAWLVLAPGAPNRLRRLASTFRSVKFGGLELVASLESPTETKQTLENAFADLRNQARAEFERLARAERVRERLGILVTKHVPEILPDIPADAQARWTLHVADISFENNFYQLVDYYPAGGGSGRTFSTRYGIVGKAWRSGLAEVRGDVSRDVDALILEWGMTREEAQKASAGRPSFLCIPLRDEGDALLGVLFADATKANAFWRDPNEENRNAYTNEFANKMEAACKKAKITEALVRITDAARKKATTVTQDEPR